MKAVLPLLAAALLWAVPAHAQQVAVADAWARATTPGVPTGAVYMTLTSTEADSLQTISTPAATRAAVHETRMDGSIMRMRAVEGGLALPAGSPVTLRPGGLHVMLEGLKAPLRTGDTVPLHLTFLHAPPIDVAARVGAPGGMGMGAMPGMPGMAK